MQSWDAVRDGLAQRRTSPKGVAMNDLLNGSTTTGVVTGSALGMFLGASYAILTGREDRLDRYMGRGSMYGGLFGILVEVSAHIGRLIGPTRTVRSHP